MGDHAEGQAAARRSHAQNSAGEHGTGHVTLIGVQILRGIAAMMVVFHHYIGTSVERGFAITGLERAAAGNAGVDIFFIISGFIMEYTLSTRPYQPGDRSRFVLRRMIRIFPLYWVLTMTAYLIATLLPFIVNSTTTSKQLMYSLVLLPDSAVGSYVLPSAWTLTFEALFYLLFAALLSAPARARMLVLALLFAPALLLPAEVSAGSPLLGILLNPIMLEFLIGVALARLFIGGASIGRPLAAGLIAMAAALLLFELNNNVTNSMQRLLIWGVPAALLVGGVVLARRTRAPAAPGLAARIGAWTGDISYSLYLSHFFAISMFSKVYFHYLINFKLPAWLAGVALFGFCLLVGHVCYIFIERPARSVLNAWLSDSRASAPAGRQARS